MRLKLTLQALHKPALLPFNYQYPLSSAIYKIIQRADEGFAAFLHNRGYGEGNKQFKLFTFSDINTTFLKNGDRMILQNGGAELVVCFYMPKAAEEFIKGLFMHQLLEIADHASKTIFEVKQVESLADDIDRGKSSVLLHPLSPIVTGRKNTRGYYDYRSPDDADFIDCLLHNWLEKYASTHTVSDNEMTLLKAQISVEVKRFSNPPQSRLITIKGGSNAETKVRGFTKFRLQTTAPKAMLELAMGTGLGLYNSQGMGCVGVIQIQSLRC